MQISAIVAMSENRVIGRNNQLPWRLPADLRHFKELTMGKAILMGRKTHESIGRVLPGRRNIIMTRNKNWRVSEAVVVNSIDAALKETIDSGEIMLIGGAELYRELLPQVKRIYMTIVHAKIEGDSYFPLLESSEWHQVSCKDYPADEDNCYAYSFVVWERV